MGSWTVGGSQHKVTLHSDRVPSTDGRVSSRTRDSVTNKL